MVRVLALALAGWLCSVDAAMAAPEIVGLWQVDPVKSRQSLNTPRARPAQEVKTLLALFGDMKLDISERGILFDWGAQKVTCGWTWKGDAIALKDCLDEKQAPAQGVESLGYKADTILFYEKDGSALSFSRR